MSEKLKEKKQNWLGKLFAGIRAKKNKKAEKEHGVEKEAERIFHKLYPQYINKRTGRISKIDETEIGSQKDKDWTALFDQVKKTRKNKTYNVK